MFNKARDAVVVVILACLVSAQFAHGQVSRLSAARLQEVAKQASQLPSLKNIAKGVVVDPKSNNKLPKIPRRVGINPVPRRRSSIEEEVSPRLLLEVESVSKRVRQTLRNDLELDKSTSPKATSNTPFGPHLLVGKAAREIIEAGAIFEEATTKVAKGLRLSKSEAPLIKGLRSVNSKNLFCPFKKTINCVKTSAFRTMDGSCNNLKNPIWGKANTPFERFLAPEYEDGFMSPRSKDVFGDALPLARVLSTDIHSKSTAADLHPDISHMTMEFGQLISHDVNMNTLSSGYNGGRLTCCKADGSIDNSPFKKRLGCLPIEIPESDAFFRKFKRTCMNFVRASNTPDLNCDLGVRQQLNQVTHFIDASTVYGSDNETMKDLRTGSDGLLKVTPSANGNLLLQNPNNGGCRTTGSQHCFKAGDVRANQQPGLMTLHTIFLREHNRVAGKLKGQNPTWKDERLFQEARKIVGAEIQHITYSEYLPAIMGPTFAGFFGFAPQSPGSYYSAYDETFQPAIRNGFAAAAYRFGHSTVRDHVVSGKLFKDHFLRPALMYQSSKGPAFLAHDLYTNNQQKTDNKVTDQLTNRLFEGPVAGTGMDLAATNIQRGRDHGLAGYNLWRDWCGFNMATDFTVAGGLVDHEPAVAALLQSKYKHVEDIDAWTGIVTETPLEGRAIGPTGACIIGRQFWILKHADRFYYENDDSAAKFKIGQLDEIRKTTLAKVICDNTKLTSVPKDVFQEPSGSNPNLNCATVEDLDFSQWQDCIDGGWSAWSSYSRCFGSSQLRTRKCNNPKPNSCGKPCKGLFKQTQRCGKPLPYPGIFPDVPKRKPIFTPGLVPRLPRRQ